MKKTYQVIITRDVTMSTVIVVADAKDEDDAEDLALERYQELAASGKLSEELDDCNNGAPYITGCDELDV